jgi:AraC-like DNA-binding protein
MPLLLDTRLVPPPDRVEVVREMIATTMVRLDIGFPAEGPMALGTIAALGSLGICSVRSNAIRVERTAKFARDDVMPSIFLGLQIAGSSLVIQGNREAVLRPGNLVLWDTTAPYTLMDEGGIRQHFFRISLSDLALPYDAIRLVSALTLTPGHPMADLAVTYFQRIASRPDLLTRPGADAVGQPSIELVRALITSHLDAAALGTEPLHATLRLRVLEYVRAHLAEPGLSATQIATEHHISVRHLYNVLAEGDITLGDWIRARRLEGCRNDLSRPTAQFVAIASLAHRWGFSNASSFGRSFRAAYGMSPSEWRDSRLRTSGENSLAR